MDRTRKPFSFLSSRRNRFQLVLFVLTLAIGLQFYLFYITFKMAPAEIASFLNSPYYKLADVKMLHFFTRIGTATLAAVAVLILLSIFTRNFWCRYPCPYGALMGIISLFSPTAVFRKSDTCTHCLQCSSVCPSHLPVNIKNRVYSPECSGCMDCINVCPAVGTLSIKTSGFHSFRWNGSRFAIAVSILFFAIVYTAQITGHWKSGISDGEFRMLLKMIDSPMLVHPTF